MSTINNLKHSIQTTIDNILLQYNNWPCNKGCDYCCNNIEHMPYLTIEEIEMLNEGIKLLDKHVIENIKVKIKNLNEHFTHFKCPFISSEGHCLVYDHRPIACRTYGFYISNINKSKGLFCYKIQELESSNKLNHIIWGNYNVISTQLESMGKQIPIINITLG